MRKVLIGIPTYFGNQLVVNCVASILQHVPHADVRILKNDIGWLKAANKLMVAALNEQKDILLLNDDTFLLSDVVSEFQKFINDNPKAGVLGGKALAPNQDTVINYGIYVATDGNTAHKYYGKRRSEITQPEKQKAVEGSCLYIRNEVIMDIGIFDEGYGSGYREEVDYCFRAREKGYDVVSIPTAEYVHFVNQTHGKLNIHNDTYEYFMGKWGTKLKLGEV